MSSVSPTVVALNKYIKKRCRSGQRREKKEFSGAYSAPPLGGGLGGEPVTVKPPDPFRRRLGTGFFRKEGRKIFKSSLEFPPNPATQFQQTEMVLG